MSGLTLVELVLTLTVTSVLMGGLVSAVVIVTRSVDDGTSPTANAVRAADAASQVTADLRCALAVSERSRRAVTFTVPDRNGDTVAETIRYAWSGVPGDPLTRQYNGGTVVPVASNVQNFDLSFLLQTAGPPPGACCLLDHSCTYTTAEACAAISGAIYEGSGVLCDMCPVESAETLLVSRDWGTASDIKSYTLKSNTWCAECFKPALPGNTVYWKITRVKVKLKRYLANVGTIYIRIRDVDANNKPVLSAYLGSASVNAASLSSSSWTWAEVAYPVSSLDPNKSYAVTAETTAVLPLAYVAYDGKASDTTMAWTTGNGATWGNPDSTKAMEIYVYGTVTTQP